MVSSFCQAQSVETSSKVQTFKSAVLKTSSHRPFKNFKSATLNSEELKLLEVYLLNRIDQYNKEWGSENINLENYNRQYVAAINPTGEKIVFIKCFCEAKAQNWKQILNEVDDGGNCFFSLNINLTRQIAEELNVNGI